jgi:hypothetical protein
MNRPTFHVCVATGQNLANLIPALQLRAAEVVILETEQMRESAGNLKRALSARGIEVRRVKFDDLTPETIIRSAERIAVELGERPLVLNATGGHKLMTLALVRAMNLADELHILYAETRHDRLDWLKPVAEVEPMDDVLKLEDVLLAQGFRLVRRGDRDVAWLGQMSEREPLTRLLGDRAERLSGLFGVLNHLADEALANEPDGPLRPVQHLQYPPKDGRVFREAQALGLVDWDGKTEVVFASDVAARYFRGGWLEEYVALKLRGLHPADCACDVEIESARERTRNQFDALVVHRNRLMVVECKTVRFGRDPVKDSDYIYKLAQLARSAGGIMASGLLLSARPVTEELRRRAAANGVAVLAADEIKDVVAHLEGWMDTRPSEQRAGPGLAGRQVTAGRKAYRRR